MKHFAFKAAAIAAAMFLFSFMASAQAALITDNENMQCTVLRLVSPEGEVNLICYLEWRGDSPVTDFIFDTALLTISEDVNSDSRLFEMSSISFASSLFIRSPITFFPSSISYESDARREQCAPFGSAYRS